VKVDLRIVQQRLLPTAIEARAAVASFHKGSGQLTMWCTTQNPHIHRYLYSLMLKLPEHKVRIIAPEWAAGSARRSRPTPTRRWPRSRRCASAGR